jgi:16S rRNA G966 N2-methylase RsmD
MELINDNSVLAQIDSANAFLKKAESLQQVKEVIALAAAASAYGKQIGASTDTMNRASVIRLRAERRLGEMLVQTERNPGVRTIGGSVDGISGSTILEPPEDIPTLSKIGISKRTSSRAQDLLAIPETEFEEKLYVQPGKEINHNAVAKWAKENRQREERRQKRMDAAKDATMDDRIFVGDFRVHADRVPDGSLSLIFTDPPYDREATKMLPDLGKFAADKLAEGGSLIMYVGQVQLFDASDAIRPYLRYWWTIACLHSWPHTQMREYGIYAGWKPVLWFVKGTRDNNNVFVRDTMATPREKEHHDWQQSESEAEYWIKQLCPDDGIVCDPFLGSGTTAVAAQSLGRKWIAFEIDPETAKIAANRLQ